MAFKLFILESDFFLFNYVTFYCFYLDYTIKKDKTGWLQITNSVLYVISLN